MKKFYLTLILFSLVWIAWAQGPNNTKTYYQPANGLKGEKLKTALFHIINAHKDVGYDGLWRVYEKSDLRPNGTYWDMYSAISAFKPGASSAYKKEGDGVNREHTVPQSWFNKAHPMRSDAYHVVPTDGYVNNRRGNYPYGEVNNATYSSIQGFSKVGNCVTKGYSGTVFEPNDEYKGDLARGYFYMATCYEDVAGSWSNVFGEGTYPTLKEWQLNLLLKWAKEDPVSKKEIDRNNAIAEFQKNRNPFIDYPGLEQYIWGEKKDIAFSYDNYDGVIPTTEPTPGSGEVNNGDSVETPIPILPGEGVVLFKKVLSQNDLVIGDGYILVCEQEGQALSAKHKASDVRSGASVSIINNTISTQLNRTDKPYLITLGGTEDAYTLKVDKESYLGIASNKNVLSTLNVPDINSQWNITINGGNANIHNKMFESRSIRWNQSSPRFSTYSNGQMEVQLYRMVNKRTSVDIIYTQNKGVCVYTLTGVMVRRAHSQREALENLSSGFYIMNGRKIVVK